MFLRPKLQCRGISTSALLLGKSKRDAIAHIKAKRERYSKFLIVTRKEDLKAKINYLYGFNVVLPALQMGKRKLQKLYVRDERPTGKEEQELFKKIVELAKESKVPIEAINTMQLNLLTDDRPHQGVVLETEPLEIIQLTALTQINSSMEYHGITPPTRLLKFKSQGRLPLWLALDQVQDPQNMGALLRFILAVNSRSAYFFGVDGVVVGTKSSAPLTGTTSRASAGSLELMDQIFSTNKMIKFLRRSRVSGWRILGSVAKKSRDLKNSKGKAVPLDQLHETDKPTILVMGNEGHGIRPGVMRTLNAHTIVGSTNATRDPFMDSLNVGVAAGVLMQRLCQNFLGAKGAPAPTQVSKLSGIEELLAVNESEDDDEKDEEGDDEKEEEKDE